MINNREGSGCNTTGYFSHTIRNRKNESLNTQIYDIEASIKFKMISRFGVFNKDTVVKLNVTQLVLN
jgi:ribosomal protein S8E